MKLTNEQIINIYEGIKHLREAGQQQLPTLLVYSLIKDLKLLEPLVEVVITARDEILQAYGNENEEGTVIIPQEKIAEAQVELDRLSKIENEISNLDRIPLSSIATLTLSFDDLYLIYPVIDGEA